MLPKYITETVEPIRYKFLDTCLSIMDLSTHLDQDPHPEYRLVSVIEKTFYYFLIWELKEN